MWQDILFSIGNFVLAAALIPTILSAEKPAMSTSALTSVILVSFAIAFVTMDMWLAFAAVATCSVLWAMLLIQKFLKRR